MRAYREAIEAKYKRIAWIPEGLLSFTIPVRKKAIGYLGLSPGSSVIDVGCGTGASFEYLEDIIGANGRILGIEPSTSMLSVASGRVNRAGWKNIDLIESTVEEIDYKGIYDGALLFAMHDVFNSIAGIKKVHNLLRDSARIVCVGPKTQEKGILKAFNPFLNSLFKRMAISQDNKDRPWRLVQSVFETDQLVEEMGGLIFIYVGHR
jgi:ubiquinone/menaquinone biosynthesis C-methylase UbiE